jgi:hypothetical protein
MHPHSLVLTRQIILGLMPQRRRFLPGLNAGGFRAGE